jgi:hypothetical protein
MARSDNRLRGRKLRGRSAGGRGGGRPAAPPPHTTTTRGTTPADPGRKPPAVPAEGRSGRSSGGMSPQPAGTAGQGPTRNRGGGTRRVAPQLPRPTVPVSLPVPPPTPIIVLPGGQAGHGNPVPQPVIQPVPGPLPAPPAYPIVVGSDGTAGHSDTPTGTTLSARRGVVGRRGTVPPGTGRPVQPPPRYNR